MLISIYQQLLSNHYLLPTAANTCFEPIASRYYPLPATSTCFESTTTSPYPITRHQKLHAIEHLELFPIVKPLLPLLLLFTKAYYFKQRNIYCWPISFFANPLPPTTSCPERTANQSHSFCVNYHSLPATGTHYQHLYAN